MATSYRVTVEPVGKEVLCREDQPILDACLRAGIWLPHSCTHGTCGTCKAEVLDGEVDHGGSSSFALMDFERDEGRTLLCCATPRSDVTIEGDVEEEEGVEHFPVRDFTATVVSLDDIATDTRRIVLGLDSDLEFNPGQYLQVAVPGKGVTRTYSMANAPSEPRRVELHVRRTPGGVATDGWIFSTLQVGDEIALAGPYGKFFYREARDEPAVLIAGGTGLAPMKSIIRRVLESDLRRTLVLYQGARTADQFYDRDFFAALAKEHPGRFDYRPCLSDEEHPDFAHGTVLDVLDADRPTLSGHVGYLCGPPPMVEAAMKLLMRKRLFPRDIYREDFLDERDKAQGSGVRSPLLKR
ncbi:2Fe-2S iron-sulfur cluster binding domain-containing protein [Streptomyces sp. SID2999]|uniref:NADH:ubiquinone reductase (Na(+)-transporting) subunit F n=1 Tax=Streptomyces sp. SID2999 TaxID=2690258 RepID=UPI00136E1167|nr:2Fe-2S iron-sulfur cluster-binding protein [Streptomyces sp. SID2999]MYZ06557.1 2Fe-2S iron-sulfur cluster binding domain-containing protein [Streptomyces sp. SID2999]